MATCNECVYYNGCTNEWHKLSNIEYLCYNFKNKSDCVEVVRCKDCKHGKPLDRTKPPFKYYKDCCVLCECEDVVGDEPMVYLPSHFCGYGERK